MKRVLILVEGQTEEIVAKELLAPHLFPFDVHLAPVVVATKRPAGAPKQAGGISSWAQVRREVELLLRDSSLDCVTTMIDYYGLPTDWPGWAERPQGGAAAVAHLEASMATDLGDDRFLPYLALHETEAMVFTGPAEAAAVSGTPGLRTGFAASPTSTEDPKASTTIRTRRPRSGC